MKLALGLQWPSATWLLIHIHVIATFVYPYTADVAVEPIETYSRRVTGETMTISSLWADKIAIKLLSHIFGWRNGCMGCVNCHWSSSDRRRHGCSFTSMWLQHSYIHIQQMSPSSLWAFYQRMGWRVTGETMAISFVLVINSSHTFSQTLYFEKYCLSKL